MLPEELDILNGDASEISISKTEAGLTVPIPTFPSAFIITLSASFVRKCKS